MPLGPPLPAQPATFAALRAMQGLILSECLIGGASPFAALSAGDAAHFGVANAVFVGRPVLWGLAAKGEEGVADVLGLLNAELSRAMQLAGCGTLSALRDGLVR